MSNHTATAESSPLLTQYSAEVQRFPKLSREDEHDLAVRFHSRGEREAGVRLVEANLRYVVAIAVSYRRYGVRLSDLVSEGNIGLMTALAKFDPERGTRFVTYAAHWIRAYVLDHILRAQGMVGAGTGALRSKVFFRLKRERARIAAETSDPQEALEKLAERFGTSPEKIAVLAQRLDARDVSLDAQTHEEGMTLLDSLAAPGPSQEDELADHEQQANIESRVRAALAELDPRERYIVEARMLADDPEELSLAEIGRQLGVSRERARQLEARAKEKLRRRLEEDSVVPLVRREHREEAA